MLVLLSLVTVACSSGRGTAGPAVRNRCGPPVRHPLRHFAGPPPQTIDRRATYTAVLCTSKGDMTLALDARSAPIATNNFVFLARAGFYDGLTFHRAAKDFVIQTGDPRGNGSGGPGYTVVGEIPTDSYPVGSVGAAKRFDEPAGSFGSQFFIATGANATSLPNEYARFARVVGGLDVAKAIERLAPAGGDGRPRERVTLVAVEVRENGRRLRHLTG
jgi:cyclophilin family peptidyl-prolyl cis-trans isomerase